jgi:hypothetical protein
MSSILSQVILLLIAIFYLSENTVFAEYIKSCGSESLPCRSLEDGHLCNDELIRIVTVKSGICLSDCIREGMPCSVERAHTVRLAVKVFNANISRQKVDKMFANLYPKENCLLIIWENTLRCIYSRKFESKVKKPSVNEKWKRVLENETNIFVVLEEKPCERVCHQNRSLKILKNNFH